jgi:hypothetical protein
MTTENRGSYYHPASYHANIHGIRAKAFDEYAVIELSGSAGHPRAGQLWLNDPAVARELLAAAFEALRILDPDGTVTVRTENEEIHTLAEILPGRACGLDECDCHDAPGQDAVKQVRELLPKTTLHEPAPFTSPDLVTPPDAISAPVETGEPWRGPAQADWDESR